MKFQIWKKLSRRIRKTTKFPEFRFYLREIKATKLKNLPFYYMWKNGDKEQKCNQGESQLWDYI